jgi:hypothetical protein
MNENIRAFVAPDEAIAFRIIEPLYGATQSMPSSTNVSLSSHDRVCVPGHG